LTVPADQLAKHFTSSISDDRFTKVGVGMGGTSAHGNARPQPPSASILTLRLTTPKPDKSLGGLFPLELLDDRFHDPGMAGDTDGSDPNGGIDLGEHLGRDAEHHRRMFLGTLRDFAPCNAAALMDERIDIDDRP
jgi:hypothetical protein